VDSKTFKKRRWLNDSRILDLSFINHRGGSNCSYRTQNTVSRYTQQCSGQYYHNYRQRLLKDESGFIVIEFLLISLILVFLSYSAIEYWIVITQHQQASHLVNKYLERMSLEGRLSSADETALISDYQKIGLTVESIQATRESQGSARVLRNPRDLQSSALNLKVTTAPLVEPIWVGGLIGGSKGGSFKISVGGEVVSERIDP